jgi:hypothetical protein
MRALRALDQRGEARFFVQMTVQRLFAAATLAAGAAACASLGEPFSAHLDAPSEQVRACARWYQALERSVEEAGVKDAQYASLQGFPYLRVDRLLASLAPRAARSPAALQAYAERLAELDLQARTHEITNLPRSRIEALPGIGGRFDPGWALARTGECGALLRELDLAKPQARLALLEAARVPDDYSLMRRALGLYPLTRVALARDMRTREDEARAAYREPSPTAAPPVRFVPPAAALPRATISGLLARAQFDPLGQPLLSGREFTLLAAVYAPAFEIAVAGDEDHFGELYWRRGAAGPQVEGGSLVVYVQPAYTRYGEQVLLQIVYTIWFPGLDGFVWRVTLAPDGEPLLYDSVHACGSYHEFFPTPRARLRPVSGAPEAWALVPARLPRVADGERPVVRLASGSHLIESVRLARAVDSLTRNKMRPYDELRSLPRTDLSGASAFGPDGLIAGSERGAISPLWASGIAAPGAMRQWGRQPTSLVGRRHFDDADLIERRFELERVGGAS